jgi:hypothetical protein
MSQDEPAAQLTVLRAPRSNLQLAVFWQVAVESAPALSSHFEEPSQVIRLWAPPFPLHSDVSSHMTVTGPGDVALHFAALMQASEQPTTLQVVMQSVPAAHIQESALQVQPVPVHVVAADEPPQPRARASASAATEITRVRGDPKSLIERASFGSGTMYG